MPSVRRSVAPRARVRAGLIAALIVVAAVLVLVGAFGTTSRHEQSARHRVTQLGSAPSVVRGAPVQAGDGGGPQYLQEAETAFDASRAWWDERRGWYRQFLPSYGRSGLATMWGIVHLFGASNAIAIADPTPAHVDAARRFAAVAERYFNPDLKPVPGYGPLPDHRGPALRAWYDDAAWWGVAFVDAYSATGDHADLVGAERALIFTDSGWDPVHGGIFWDNRRTFKASESLAGAMLTAAALYQTRHDERFLRMARRYLAWADATIRGKDGLYGGRSTPAGPMAYVEGPIAEALLRLCDATGDRAYCARGEALMRRTVARFPVPRQGPQYDALYIRSVVQVFLLDHDPRWLRVARDAADAVLANARDENGLFLRTWDGRPLSTIGTSGGRLRTHAASTSVLAWTAVAMRQR